MVRVYEGKNPENPEENTSLEQGEILRQTVNSYITPGLIELGPQYETALILKAIRIFLQSLFTSTCCYKGNQLDIFSELHLPCLQRTLFRT